MPIANIKCVREVSSEDYNFCAENLLKQDPGKKWKTKNVGETSAYAIFELDKPSQIIGIDIGNEHSAFVEILVSNKGCRHEDFTEILLTCSFMTPTESKNSSNPNRVRCFNKDALVPTAVIGKWHLVKIICTQPFNKHVQYGISFIKLHVAESELLKKDAVPKTLVPEKFLLRKPSTETKDVKDSKNETILNRSKMFANFALREDSPDSDSESSVSLFNRWKSTRGDNNLPSTAAAIREASTSAGLKKLAGNTRPILTGNRSPNVDRRSSINSNESDEMPVRDRNRDDLTFSTEDNNVGEDKKLQRLSKQIEEEKKRLQTETAKNEKEKKEKKVEKPKTTQNNDFGNDKNKSTSGNASMNSSKKTQSLEKTDMDEEKNNSLNVSTDSIRNKKRHSSPNNRPAKKMKSVTKKEYKPFHELLRGVVLVISGIQNPDRAALRGKAVAMGAKYKADWDATCTHLICAFKNTPKYNQVKGKGKIVNRSWIEKCFDLKKYLPWRRYALDNHEQAQPESDNEILDISLKPVVNDDDDNISIKSVEDEIQVQNPKVEKVFSETTSEIKGSSMDVDNYEGKSFIIESGSDTDDEIQRVLEKNKKENNKTNSQERSVYDVTTEEEDYVQDKIAEGKESLNFFSNLKFLIADDITNSIREQINRCIQQYDGKVTSNIKEANYVVSDKGNINVNSLSIDVVKPQWIFECNDMETKVPISQYLISNKY